MQKLIQCSRRLAPPLREVAHRFGHALRRANGTGVIITGLVMLCLYVALGFGPFSASGYDRQGMPIEAKTFGSSSEAAFTRY